MTDNNQLPEAETLYQQGCNLCREQNYQPALEAFNQAINQDRTYSQAWNGRANALSQLNRQAEAFASYSQAIALSPRYHQAWFNQGVLLKEMGAYGNALESFEKAIAINPDPIYFHQRDEIYLKRKIFA